MRRSPRSQPAPASSKKPLKSYELDQRLSRYALAAAAAGVGILGSSPASEAEIVYTPAHQQIAPNTVVNIDVNNDGIADFELKDTFSTTFFSSFAQMSAIPLGKQNLVRGHVVSNRAYASALLSGAIIRPGQQFLAGTGEMANLSFLGGAHHPPASGTCTAPWANVQDRFLGLRFVVAGEVHFGWARLNVGCTPQGSKIGGLLTGYAYETVPNRPIVAGRESGTEDSDDSAQQGGASAEPAGAQAASLGRLAQGALGLSAWRGR